MTPLRIPIVENRVDIATPKILNPSDYARAPVRGAFGEFESKERIGNAISGAGEDLSKIAHRQREVEKQAFIKHAEKKSEDYRNLLESQEYNKFVTGVNERLLSDADEDINVNGQTVTKKYGYQNRLNSEADGITKEGSDWYHKSASDMISQVPDDIVRQRLSQRISDNFPSYQNKLLSHETTQLRNNQELAHKAGIQIAVDNAAMATDESNLLRSLNDAQLEQDAISNLYGLPPELRDQKRKEANALVINSAVLGNPMSQDPTGRTSKEILDRSKDILTDKDFKEIDKNINGAVKQAKENFKIKQISKEAEVIKSISNHQFDFSDQSIGELMATRDVRPDFANALMQYSKAPDDIITQDSDEIYLSTITSLFNLNNQEKINNSVIDILSGYSGNKSDSKDMAILIKSAQDYAGKREIESGARVMIKMAADAGLDPKVVVPEYINALHSGLTPKEAREQVLDSYSITGGQVSNSNFGPSINVSKAENKGGFFEKHMLRNPVVDYNTNFVKGFITNIASNPQAIGALQKEYGENPEENGGFWRDILGLEGTKVLKDSFGVDIKETEEQKVARQAMNEIKIKSGQKMIDDNEKWLADMNLKRPESGIFNQFAFDLGGVGGSILQSVGTAVLTKNPTAAAAVMGALQKGRIYEEARTNNVDPKTASQKSTQAGLFEAGIELVGLNWILKNHGGKIVNLVKKSFGSSLEEVGQTTAEDTIAQDWRKQSGMQRMQNALYSGVLGFLGGGTVSTFLDISNHKQNIADLKKAGLSQEEAENVIVKTTEKTFESLEKVSEEIDSEYQDSKKQRLKDELQAFKDSDYVNDIKSRAEEARNANEPAAKEPKKPKKPKIKPELQPLADLAKSFNTVEEFVEAVVPSKKQVLVRKFMTNFYTKVVGVSESVAKDEQGQPLGNPKFEASMGKAETIKQAVIAKKFFDKEGKVEASKKMEEKIKENSLTEEDRQNIKGYLKEKNITVPDFKTPKEANEFAIKNMEVNGMPEALMFKAEEIDQRKEDFKKNNNVKSSEEIAELPMEKQQEWFTLGAEAQNVREAIETITEKPVRGDERENIREDLQRKAKNDVTTQEVSKQRQKIETNEVSPQVVVPKVSGNKKKSKAYARSVEKYEEELSSQPNAFYPTINIADQVAKSIDLLEADPELGRKIAYGMEQSPNDIRETAVAIVYAERMLEEGNYEEYGRVVRARSLRQSLRGQEIVLEKSASTNVNNPEHFISQVVNAKMALAGKRFMNVKAKKDAPSKRALDRIKKETSKIKKDIVNLESIDISEAQKIIDSLAC